MFEQVWIIKVPVSVMIGHIKDHSYVPYRIDVAVTASYWTIWVTFFISELYIFGGWVLNVVAKGIRSWSFWLVEIVICPLGQG